MKKSFKLFSAALMALAMFVPAQAEVLTIFDGGAVSTDAPVYGYNYDTDGYITQTIFPADQLTAMVGKPIKSMKFYVYGEAGNLMENGKLSVSVGTTTTNAFAGGWSAVAFTGLTHVADITMTKGENEIVIAFDEPFLYEGDNLVFEGKVIETGVYGETPFYGATSNINNVIHKGTWTTSVAQFNPMTTFEYGDGSAPEVLLGDVNSDGVVNPTDATVLIGALLNEDLSAVNVANADMDGNGDVNVTDAIQLINYLLTL